MSTEQATLHSAKSGTGHDAVAGITMLTLSVAMALASANAHASTAPERALSQGVEAALVVDNTRQQTGQLQGEVANVNVLQQYQEIIDMMTPKVLEEITNAEDAEHARRILIAYFNEIND